MNISKAHYAISGHVWHTDGKFHASDACLAFECDGARFHIWLNPETGKLRDATDEAPNDGWLYKNSPLEIKRGEPGHFDTRTLDASKPVNVARIAAAIAMAGDYWEAMRAAVKAQHEKDAAETAERKAAARVARIKEHGDLLLNAARDVLAHSGDAAYLARLQAVCDAADPAPIKPEGF